MQIIINLLVIFIIVSTLMKLSFWKIWQVLTFVFIAVGFTFWAYPIAMEQSQTTIKEWMGNSEILGNMAVLITLESTILLFYCIYSMKESSKDKNKIWKTVLDFFPGILIFPVLFFLLCQMFFQFTGTDFLQSSLLFSMLLITIVVAGFFLFRKLIPEHHFRLEILFLTSLFVSVLGLISTSSGKMIFVAKSEPLDFQKLALTTGLFISLFAIGYFFNRLWWNYFNK